MRTSSATIRKRARQPCNLRLKNFPTLIDNGFGPGVTLLISATEVDKRRSFYKTLVKRAELQVFDRLDSARAGWEEEATEIVRQRAKKRKLQFDDDALDLFVLLTGGDTRQIENELEKIDTFLGKDRSVRVELVRELVPVSRAGVIFELSNALSARDLERWTDAGAPVVGARRKRCGHFAGGHRANHPQFITGERSDGAAWDSASAFAVSIHCCHEPAAGKSNRAFAS